jgi:group I intron endonuclease
MKVIYQILNINNGDFYLGSSSNFNVRKTHHVYLLKTNKHHSIHLQNAVNKYGIENFKFLILEVLDNHCSKADIIKIEQYYLDTLNPKYNIEKIVGVSRLGITHKIKNSITRSDEYKLKQRISHTGKTMIKWTDERREKFIKSTTGKKRTEETKKKISEVQKGKLKDHIISPVIMICKNTNQPLKIFKKLADAMEFVTGQRIGGSNILKAAKDNNKSAFGYKWEKI